MDFDADAGGEFEDLAPSRGPQGAEADRVAVAMLLVRRYCALFERVAVSPWYGPVRDGLNHARSGAGWLLDHGYGYDPAAEGEGRECVGQVRDDLRLPATEEIRPYEPEVAALVELARKAFDFAAAPERADDFAVLCALADRLEDQEGRLRAEDLAALMAARESGAPPAGATRRELAEPGALAWADRLRETLRGRGHHFGRELTDFPMPVTDFGKDLLRETAAAMAARFGLSDEEAATRTYRAFRDQDLTDEETLLFIGHQLAEEWAVNIYLGVPLHEIDLDADLSGYEPRPLPE